MAGIEGLTVTPQIMLVRWACLEVVLYRILNHYILSRRKAMVHNGLECNIRILPRVQQMNA